MSRCPFCERTVAAGTQNCPKCGAALPTDDTAPRSGHSSGTRPSGSSAVNESDLLSLLRQGKKIEAIKRYREQTGVGLAEAKSAVEMLESSGRLPAAPGSGPDLVGETDFETTLLRLLERGEKIEAIRQFRAKSRTGLKEAKDAVEALAAQHGGFVLADRLDLRGGPMQLLQVA
jgi:ribosomal protein L7/L12